MHPYREAQSFHIRVELSAEFGDDYEGDDDGYAWHARWLARVRPALLRAVHDALKSDPHFTVVPSSRGANPDENAEFTVSFAVPTPPREPG
jgi:hypothetical protein